MREHIYIFDKWKKDPRLNELLKKEILSLKKDSDIEDRFYKKMEFGTAGIRGLLGVGINRMNLHTVGEVTQALSLKIKRDKKEEQGVVIGYDTRNMSKEFAEAASSILSRNGIKVHLFKTICTTPLLSYSVRELNAEYGIMITASHNPKEYNGYKVYGADGTQIDRSVAKEISDLQNTITDIFSIDVSLDLKKVLYVESSLIDSYMNKALNVSFNENIDKEISIVYTPLHGTGYEPMRKAFESKGYKNVFYVEEQKMPDSNFTTVHSPNPEEETAFEYAIKTGLTYNADILLATDPDSDRVGAMVKHDGNYRFLSGNMIGTIMVNYILEQLFVENKMPKNPKIVKTIVTSNIVDKIAEKYGVEVFDVHVGFKNIYSLVNEWESQGDYGYIIGYEESLGFGIGAEIARDKDAITASLVLSEMAAYYKKFGKSLIDVYREIEELYGFQSESLKSITLPGKNGKEKMDSIIKDIRAGLSELGDLKVTKSKDYLEEGKDVLKFILEDNSWFVVRPSGTEPKLKLYFYSSGERKDESEAKVKKMEESFMKIIKWLKVNSS